MSKRVGIWIRVSTEDQAQGDSPEHHEMRAKNYASAKNWNVIETYHLEAVSGKSVLHHSEAIRMINDIQSGHITGIIFSKLARLARNTKELLEISDIFQKYNADLTSLDESIDTSTPVGRFFYTLIAAMSEWEREEIASRVKASIEVRAKLGKPLGGKAPFGYKWEDKQLALDPEEAPVRKLIHELFAKHKRKMTVARYLNDNGYRTRKGGKFSDTSIGRMLQDPVVKGMRRINYTESPGPNKPWKLKPKEEWVFVETPRIITDELWETCNNILNEMAAKQTKRRRKGIHLFTSVIRCSCGGKMYMRSTSPKYVCQECKNKISPDDLETIFHAQLEKFLFSDTDIQTQLDKEKQIILSKEKLLNTRKNQFLKTKENLEKLLNLYYEEDLPKDALKEQYNELYTKQKQIEKSIIELQSFLDIRKTESIGNTQVVHDAQVLHNQWHTFTKQQKKDIIELITHSIVVGKDDIEIKLAYLPTEVPKPTQVKSCRTTQNPYFVKECKYSTHRQGCVDSKTLKIV